MTSSLIHAIRLPKDILVVKMARSSKRNAVSPRMLDDLAGLLVDFRPTAVVLTGSGRDFCAGIDVTSLASFDPAKYLAGARHGGNTVQNAATLALRRLPVPKIAAVHGRAWGAGCQLAMGADVRVLADADPTSVSLKEVALGLVPDMGVTVSGMGMRRDVLMWMACSGKELSAKEAVDLGWGTVLAQEDDHMDMDDWRALVDEVGEDGQSVEATDRETGRRGALRTALAMANTIAEQDPVAVKNAHELVSAMFENDVEKQNALLGMEEDKQLQLLKRMAMKAAKK